MTTIFISIFFFVVALGILIAVHEAGHFIVARMCGVYVERFALGFGPRLFSFHDSKGTEYALCAVPLGGYVKMFGEEDDSGDPEKKQSGEKSSNESADAVKAAVKPERNESEAFCKKKLWQKFLIVFAGPFFNIVLAWFLYTFTFIYGIPDFKPVIDITDSHGVAAEAGIASEDLIVAVDGVEVTDWEDTIYELVSHVGEEKVSLELVTDLGRGTHKNVDLNLKSWEIDPRNGDILGLLGISPLRGRIINEVAQVMDGSAADKAGFKVGDKFISFDGRPYTSWREFSEVVRSSPDKNIRVVVERERAQVTLDLRPEVKTGAQKEGEPEKRYGFAGLSPRGEEIKEVFFERKYNPFVAVVKGATKTVRMGVVTFEVIKKFFTGDLSIKNVSGPIGIAKGAGFTAKLGLVFYLGFIAMVSVNLGLLNLLPIPVMDGGHLMFYIIEGVRGKPLSPAIMQKLLILGMCLLMSLMVLAVFNDIYYGL